MTLQDASDQICALAEKRGLVFPSDVQREVFSSAIEDIIAEYVNTSD